MYNLYGSDQSLTHNNCSKNKYKKYFRECKTPL
jgi:hypothetical protein